MPILEEAERVIQFASTHKTSGIAREEWALVFSAAETALLDKVKVAFSTAVDPDLSFIDLSGKSPSENGFKTLSLGDDAGAISDEYAGIAVVDVVRSGFARYSEMTGGLSLNDSRLVGSIMLFHALGWLDNENRLGEILQGVPYEKLK